MQGVDAGSLGCVSTKIQPDGCTCPVLLAPMQPGRRHAPAERAVHCRSTSASGSRRAARARRPWRRARCTRWPCCCSRAPSRSRPRTTPPRRVSGCLPCCVRCTRWPCYCSCAQSGESRTTPPGRAAGDRVHLPLPLVKSSDAGCAAPAGHAGGAAAAGRLIGWAVTFQQCLRRFAPHAVQPEAESCDRAG